MGKAAADYDAQTLSIRNAYLRAISFGNWIIAAHFVIMLNKTIRPANRVLMNDGKRDLQPFRFKRTNGNRGNAEQQAMDWCFKHQPLVEDAISIERAALLREYE